MPVVAQVDLEVQVAVAPVEVLRVVLADRILPANGRVGPIESLECGGMTPPWIDRGRNAVDKQPSRRERVG